MDEVIIEETLDRISNEELEAIVKAFQLNREIKLHWMRQWEEYF